MRFAFPPYGPFPHFGYILVFPSLLLRQMKGVDSLARSLAFCLSFSKS